MAALEVAVVGTGGIANGHARGYDCHGECELVACADLDFEAAEAFADKWDIDPDGVFKNYDDLIDSFDVDVVSVCTPEPTHEEIVAELARSGVPDAIHTEKIMADTWAGATRMARVCEQRGVQLTVNHQRRVSRPWVEAKRRLDEGAIGELERLEVAFSDLFTYGTHQFDLCGMFVDDRPVEWVIGQVDCREGRRWNGVPIEDQAVALWTYEDGVTGLASSGTGSHAVGVHNRIRGTEGSIEVRRERDDDGSTEYVVAVRQAGDGNWEQTVYESDAWERAVEDVVTGILDGTEPELRAANALTATELSFAVYESARRRGRVDLPLTIPDNPLASMVESGEVEPNATDG